MNIREFKQALRSGPYAWPGGYPFFYICDDGGTLCCDCARKELRQIASAINAKRNDGWRVVAQDINWVNDDLHCDNCNQPIESAYGQRP